MLNKNGKLPVIKLEDLPPGTLLRYFVDEARTFLGIVIWHKHYPRGHVDQRRQIGVIWDVGARQTMTSYDGELNGLVISVVQLPSLTW